MEPTFDAIIIGAGLAGLSAGLELKRFNKSFLLLEASQQVGGRTRTLQTKSGECIDLGAQWIGPKKLQPRIHDLIERFGLTKVKTYKNGKNVYEFEGKIRHRPEWLPPIPLKSLLELRFVSSKINKITELLQPLGSIHWAGSESANEWRMYMEGAIQSGMRAANEVVKRLGGH